jgi:hypothetical protein
MDNSRSPAALHAPDSLLVLVGFEVVKVGPPLEKHSLADELEPRGEGEGFVLEHGPQLVGGDVFVGLDLVGVDVKVDGGLREQDVVDCCGSAHHSFPGRGPLTLVFTPLSIARRLVVDPRQELEDLRGHLVGRDAELLVQLALGRTLDAHDGGIKFGTGLTGDAERVRAAGIGPHACSSQQMAVPRVSSSGAGTRERNLLVGALLQEQTLLRIEKKYGEGTVQQAALDVGH